MVNDERRATEADDLLTLTTREALRLDMVELRAANLEDLLGQLGLANVGHHRGDDFLDHLQAAGIIARSFAVQTGLGDQGPQLVAGRGCAVDIQPTQKFGVIVSDSCANGNRFGRHVSLLDDI